MVIYYKDVTLCSLCYKECHTVVIYYKDVTLWSSYYKEARNQNLWRQPLKA